MDFTNLEEVLNKYAKYVVQQAKSNLAKDGKGSGVLYESVKYTLEKEADLFLLDFLMEDYGIYVDEGVSGAKSKNIRFRNAKGQYAKGSNRSMGFVLQKSIFAQGLKPNYFFTKPFNKGIKTLSPELAESFILDIEDAIILGQKR